MMKLEHLEATKDWINFHLLAEEPKSYKNEDKVGSGDGNSSPESANGELNSKSAALKSDNVKAPAALKSDGVEAPPAAKPAELIHLQADEEVQEANGEHEGDYG
mmetsp:Transcript_24734/g.55952  ORF Transcript_24734/g.55952 Transcript_24734/m.55952 type:complete len:104 (+) Transcript_24734:936-1247(+)